MTTEIILTEKPVKITDGNETAFISCRNGDFRFADSDIEPDTAASHSTDRLSVDPPYIIWIWAGSATTVSVSKRKA